MDAFIKKGFYTIGTLKTNRILYPCGIKQKISEFVLYLRKTDSDVSLVTVGSRNYYVYRYEGNLNGIDNAVVLISYPKDRSMSQSPAGFYQHECFFKHSWDPGQICETMASGNVLSSVQGQTGIWQIPVSFLGGNPQVLVVMLLAHLIACTGCGEIMSFMEEVLALVM